MNIEKSPKKEHSRLVQEIIGFAWAFLVMMIFRSFLIQPFHIPSSSMYPTLMIGDFLVASKLNGISRFSISIPKVWMVMPEGRLFWNPPKRGEVVIFTGTVRTHMDFIKRCVGLPGDRIQVKEGVLHINGEPVKLKQIEDYQLIDEQGHLRMVPQYIETLPNGVEHKILKIKAFGEGTFDNTQEWIVPEDHFFMMGDNRDNSLDSRKSVESGGIGMIPKDYIIGIAEALFFSTSAKWYQLDEWTSGLRPSRFFTLIR